MQDACYPQPRLGEKDLGDEGADGQSEEHSPEPVLVAILADWLPQKQGAARWGRRWDFRGCRKVVSEILF